MRDLEEAMGLIADHIISIKDAKLAEAWVLVNNAALHGSIDCPECRYYIKVTGAQATNSESVLLFGDGPDTETIDMGD